MEKKTVKAASEKAATKTAKSVNKITKTAREINNQVTDAVEDIMEDVKATGKEIRSVATQGVKDVAKKMDVNANINKIKETAKNVGEQIQETASEVFEDVKASAKDMQANAVKIATEAIENINVTDRVASIKKTVKTVNEFTLETAEEIVDGLAANGEKWTAIANKAMKNGFKLAERQQDILFTSLETVKGQWANSAARFKKIFGKQKPATKVEAAVEEVLNA
jgi:hypothetical protein